MKVKEEPMATRTIRVFLEIDTDFIDERVEVKEGTTTIHPKKDKTKGRKDEYKKRMKEPKRYKHTRMADSDHPSILMRKSQSDSVTFYCVEEFVLFTTRDPEIDEDFDGPDSPFIDSTSAPLTYKVSEQNTTAPAEERFFAGPYTLAQDTHKQMFYKFSVVTKSGKILDPDLITEQ
jgi:hypothetical protein